jgi:uracil phosphoribosyltransferase
MDKVTVVKHPLLENSLTILRDKNTKLEVFREHSAVVSRILFLEATKNLELKPKIVETPLISFTGSEISGRIVAVPILRAGLAMLFAIQEILPTVAVGLIGLERDEETARAREYYRKFPKILPNDKVFIIDPMLATGGSIDDALKALKEKKIRVEVVISIVSAPEGIARIVKNYPDVSIYTAAIDKGLNNKKYIVPGLGDYGDRYFGTDVS